MRACVLLEDKTFSPEFGETFPGVVKVVVFYYFITKPVSLSTFYIQL